MPDGCIVHAMPRCMSRAQMVSWYLREERGCPIERSLSAEEARRGYDLYQFGVPSEMVSLIPLLEAKGGPGSGPYASYNGFDSFVGLSDEAPGALRPSSSLWGAGQFSSVHTMSRNFRMRRGAGREEVYVPTRPDAQPLSVGEVMRLYLTQLGDTDGRRRVRLVPGFYNESLTRGLARKLRAAAYVDINCDLYASTRDALRWLLAHGLLRAGSLLGYDDWFETPFLRGGESMAHLEAAEDFGAKFEVLTPPECRNQIFRLRAVGGGRSRGGHGITRRLATRSCAALPMLVRPSERAVPVENCTRDAFRRLGFSATDS